MEQQALFLDRQTQSFPATGIQFKFFFLLLTVFSSSWLIANIAAVKMVSIFGVTFTGGFFIFPLTSICNTVIVEVYGYKNSRQAIWCGFLVNACYVVFINIVNIIPAAPHWQMHDQFHHILIPGSRIVLASIVSFFLADFIHSYLMAKMKIITRGKALYRRILVATFISFSLDILLFTTASFYHTLSNAIFLKLLWTVYLKKLACQIVFLPVIGYGIARLKKAEGVDIYDQHTSFNPFSLDNVYEIPLQKKS